MNLSMQGVFVKKNLGRVFLFLYLLQLSLFASSYEWSVESSKTQAYTNEAIHLKYRCSFSDKSELYVIEFNPLTDNPEYTLELFSEKERIVDNKRTNTYEFILFVKKAGEFRLSLDTTIKKTNKDSIENGVLGRDNANYEDFSIVEYKQKSVVLDILDAHAQLVGDFQLVVKKDTPQVKAYEPYHLEVEIKGLGGFEYIKEIHWKIADTKIFTQSPTKEILLTPQGYKGVWKQKFAFVSDKDFTIPSFDIEYFDLQTKSLKKLHFEAVDVKVAKAYEPKQLLDDEEKSFSFDISYLYYLMSFVLGFIVAKIRWKRVEKATTKEDIFREKVQKAKTIDELHILLVLENERKYKDILKKIETKELKQVSDLKRLLFN